MSGRRQPPTPDELVERLRRHLRLLGLTLTEERLDEHLAWAAREKPGAGALLEHVLGAEAAYKLERRIERRIALSGLRERKTLEAFDWAFQPGLDKSFVMELASLEFVRRKEDLVLTGKSGTGKSHLLQAIGLRACQAQLSVRYAAIPTRTAFDERSAAPGSTQQISLKGISVGGTYYVMVQSDQGATAYSLVAEKAPFFVTEVSPKRTAMRVTAPPPPPPNPYQFPAPPPPPTPTPGTPAPRS